MEFAGAPESPLKRLLIHQTSTERQCTPPLNLDISTHLYHSHISTIFRNKYLLLPLNLSFARRYCFKSLTFWISYPTPLCMHASAKLVCRSPLHKPSTAPTCPTNSYLLAFYSISVINPRFVASILNSYSYSELCSFILISLPLTSRKLWYGTEYCSVTSWRP